MFVSGSIGNGVLGRKRRYLVYLSSVLRDIHLSTGYSIPHPCPDFVHPFLRRERDCSHQLQYPDECRGCWTLH